jgi:CDP-glycerol glycerophosphotransferase
MQFVYNSFEGRFSDSPRVLHAALAERFPEARHVWIADPVHAEMFPAGVETVAYHSGEDVAALEGADAVVANTHTDVEWDKPPATVYLQTWHGTPLKRIHWDVLWAPEGRLERLQRDVDRWDVLLSPNAVSTPYLRSAFRFDGREIVETGYPRNDVLVGPERDAVGARVRRELGIPQEDTTILYAPTWRDDLVFSGAEGAAHLRLEPAAIADALGPGHTLLLRLHYLVSGRMPDVEHPAVRDVSAHPDIAELYAAADVLVTDYSSSMFDFANTGRPLLFFTYDLAEFRDSLRGFYFDFEPIAPGPLLERPDDVLAALTDLPAVTARYADRYAAFRERFCHLDDGHATDRVVARLLDRLPDAH